MIHSFFNFFIEKKKKTVEAYILNCCLAKSILIKSKLHLKSEIANILSK